MEINEKKLELRVIIRKRFIRIVRLNLLKIDTAKNRQRFMLLFTLFNDAKLLRSYSVGDRWGIMVQWWENTDGENRIAHRKNRLSATLFTTNPTKINLVFNPGISCHRSCQNDGSKKLIQITMQLCDRNERKWRRASEQVSEAQWQLTLSVCLSVTHVLLLQKRTRSLCMIEKLWLGVWGWRRNRKHTK
jgi:hypothetical protein